MKFKNVSILTLITSLCFSSGLIYASNFSDNTMEISTYEVSIPLQMQPGTILTFDENLNTSIIEILDTSRNISYSINGELLPEDLLDNDRHAEDLFIQSMKDEVKHLPVIDLGMDLPDPSPGLTIMYGDDGQITRYYFEDELYSKASTPPNTHLPEGTRLPAGSYTWGSYPNTATITSSSVTGEGRFTVFRPNVGGSGNVGSSGKVLETGDVATRRTVDNPKSNTALTARALDTNVVRTVYKNDIGSMPNAVLDVFFWGWDDPYFGYYYSDTLSFPGRYFYTF